MWLTFFQFSPGEKSIGMVTITTNCDSEYETGNEVSPYSIYIFHGFFPSYIYMHTAIPHIKRCGLVAEHGPP